MFFSKINLNQDLPLEQKADLIPRNSYEMHQEIWKLFKGNDDSEREFLFHHIEQNNNLSFYVLSLQQPISHEYHWKIYSKEFSPIISNQQKFHFSLRANPIVKKKDATGKSKKHDVIMNGKKEWITKHGEKPLGRDRQMMIFNSTYEWFKKRGELNGFQIDKSNLYVDAYTQHKFLKSSGQPPVKRDERIKNNKTQYSTVDLSGVLEVSNPTQFRHCLFNGIGSAKGFGCGLLLIRPLKL